MDADWSSPTALLDALGCFPRLSTGAHIEVEVALAMRLTLEMVIP